MIRFCLGLLTLAGLLVPAVAAGKCEGRDLLPEIAASDPAAHARILSRGAAIRHGEGKLWEVSKPGIPPSVIFGTYHDTGIADQPLPAAAVYALDNARVMMVEITPDEQKKLRQRIASDPDFAFDLDGPGWVGYLTPEQRALAERALAERGLELAVVARMRPWMLMSVLGVPRCQLAQMATGKPVLDAMLIARAQQNGTPVLGLESYLDAIGAFDLIDMEGLRAIAVDLLAQVGDEEDTRATMVELYRDGRIGALMEFGIWHSAQVTGEESAREIARIFSDAIITHRNRQWMDALEDELRKGNAFVAFGALHLIGEEGVLALLQDRGWDVLRLDG